MTSLSNDVSDFLGVSFNDSGEVKGSLGAGVQGVGGAGALASGNFPCPQMSPSSDITTFFGV